MQFDSVRIIIPLLSIVIVSWNGITPAASSSYGVFTNDSTPFESPYPVWAEKWVSWWTGIPFDKHPSQNYSDTERCSVMQAGPVWFLPDVIPGKGKISINCSVPVGKAILIPITTTFCDRGLSGPLTDIELTECADNILTPINNMIVTVDGERVDVSKLFTKTGFFNITYPERPTDLWGPVQPGTYRTIATGFYLFLHDLSPGTHEIGLRVVDLLKGNEGPPPRFDPEREGIFKIVVQ